MHWKTKILIWIKQKEIQRLLDELEIEYKNLCNIFLGTEIYEDKRCIKKILSICNELEKYESKGIRVIDYNYLYKSEISPFCNSVLELKNKIIKIGNDIEERNIRLTLYNNARKLEKNYEFEDALDEYFKIHKMYPSQIGPILSIAELYKKLNKLEISIMFLKDMMKKEYYDSCISYKHNLDKKLADLEEKYKRGYVYRPRKKKK